MTDDPLRQFVLYELQTIALTILVVLYAIKIWKLMKLPVPAELPPARGSLPRAVATSYASPFLPWSMGSTRKNLGHWVAFILYHLGILTAIAATFTIPFAPQIMTAPVRWVTAVLIVAAFAGAGGIERLTALHQRASGLGLDVLVEVHDEAELEAALGAGADLVGINNRNLETFEVDLATTERLAGRIPQGVVLVAESGIFTNDDIGRLERAGAGAFLVGEALMREPDVGAALRSLRRNS